MKKNCRIGARLHRIDLLMRYHLRSRDRDMIPPAQMRMLEYVTNNDGCTQAELAESMQVTPASVAQSLKRMENAGFIDRAAREGDMRANSLHITKLGLEAAANCRRVFDGLEECMFAGFTDGEKETTNALLDRLISNLESADTGEMNNMELSELLSGRGPERSR
ncbi:MAG: MarR family transcriptional regulator [Clostridia bacterium]|nr:MarR family transcriptional regulator [Clostridia bacterium]